MCLALLFGCSSLLGAPCRRFMHEVFCIIKLCMSRDFNQRNKSISKENSLVCTGSLLASKTARQRSRLFLPLGSIETGKRHGDGLTVGQQKVLKLLLSFAHCCSSSKKVFSPGRAQKISGIYVHRLQLKEPEASAESK
jgi:hypothetical protein